MLVETNRIATALLLVRLAVGMAFVAHGAPKIAHPTTWMDDAAFHPPAALQCLAAVAEYFGGAALIAGVGTRLAALLIGGDMLVAILAVHLPAHTPIISSHGESMELPLLYGVCALALILTGPGRWSIDALLMRGDFPSLRSRSSMTA